MKIRTLLSFTLFSLFILSFGNTNAWSMDEETSNQKRKREISQSFPKKEKDRHPSPVTSAQIPLTSKEKAHQAAIRAKESWGLDKPEKKREDR